MITHHHWLGIYNRERRINSDTPQATSPASHEPPSPQNSTENHPF